MKKLLFSGLFLLGMIAFITSCQKENLSNDPSGQLLDPTNSHVLDGTEASPLQALPDLKIIRYSTSVTATTLACSVIAIDTVIPVIPIGRGQEDAVLDEEDADAMVVTPINLRCPNVSCAGGQRTFRATVTIKNTGNRDLPPGNISVLWTDTTPVGTNSLTQTVPHPGIPVGTTIRVTRGYYMGPCDCAPPPTFFKHRFKATVDPNNAIPELNETNNMSKVYRACDGC